MEIFKTKNLLRWLMMCVTAVALSVSLAACGDDDDDDDEAGGGLRPLTGTWVSGSVNESFEGYQYVFNADGSGTAQYTTEGARVDKFSDYMVKDGHLWIKWVGDKDFDDKGLIKIIHQQFQISFDNGKHWYTFTRGAN